MTKKRLESSLHRGKTGPVTEETLLFPVTREERRASEVKALRSEIDLFLNMKADKHEKYRRLVRQVRTSKLTDAEIQDLFRKDQLPQSRASEVRLVAAASAKVYADFMAGRLGWRGVVIAARREGLSKVELAAMDVITVRNLLEKAARVSERIKLKESLRVEFGSFVVEIRAQK